jgi:NADH dehydrogenase
MGAQARSVIDEALTALGVETRTDIQITSIDAHGVILANGETIPAETVVWCTGMRTSKLGQKLGVPLDHLGRVPVDEYLRVKGLNNVFAAGDSAWFEISEGHNNVMSCQHGRPMGRYAGHNVAADLFDAPMLALRIDWYVTVLDLGPWGAVYTEGWDRHVVETGETAKQTKRTINGHRIYPPLTERREDILAAAAPDVQSPPEVEY